MLPFRLVRREVRRKSEGRARLLIEPPLSPVAATSLAEGRRRGAVEIWSLKHNRCPVRMYAIEYMRSEPHQSSRNGLRGRRDLPLVVERTVQPHEPALLFAFIRVHSRSISEWITSVEVPL